MVVPPSTTNNGTPRTQNFDIMNSSQYAAHSLGSVSIGGQDLKFNRRGGWFVTRQKAGWIALLMAVLLVLAVFLTRYFVKPGPKEIVVWTEEDKQIEPAILLSKNVMPLHYKLQIKPLLDVAPAGEKPFTLKGQVEMVLQVKGATNEVQVHYKDLVIDEGSVVMVEIKESEHPVEIVQLGGQPKGTVGESINTANNASQKIATVGAAVKIKKRSYDAKNELYTLFLSKKLVPSKNYLLSMAYSGVIGDSLYGLYRSQYVDTKNDTKKWLLLTQFESTYARRAFPCMDEPSFKATFELKVLRQKNMSSLANTKLRASTPTTDGWVWDHYETTPAMSTYLVALVVSDFAAFVARPPATNMTTPAVAVAVWAPPGQIQTAAYAASIAPHIIDYYAAYFGVPYPLPKMDLVAVPDFAEGAMENWGLVTFRETQLLYDAKVTSTRSKENIATTVAHELAHQWFGNLVTMAWWNDLWLNEGFATYIEMIGANLVEPGWDMLDKFVVDTLHPVLLLDSLKNSHPISAEVSNPSQIAGIFDMISYEKGACLIRMLNHSLTEPVFRAGVQHYLRTWKYSNAVQDDLWASLTLAARNESAHRPNGTSLLPNDKSVKQVMDTWTLNRGFPVVSVRINYTTGQAVLTQQAFSLDNASRPDTLWHIPISYATADRPEVDNTVTRFWFPQIREMTVDNFTAPGKNASWVLVNPHQTGYYRVNYERHNWDLLAGLYGSVTLPPASKAQLLSDAFNLARVGLLPYPAALNLTRRLVNETGYVVWSAALTSVGYLENALLVSPHFPLYRDYMTTLLTKLYKSLGTAPWALEEQPNALLRVMVVRKMCDLDYPHCLQWAANAYRALMNSTDGHVNNPVGVDMRGLVYCTAIRTGTIAEWQFAWQRYLSHNTTADEKLFLMRGMTCSTNPWVLNFLLEESLAGENIRLQDGSYVWAYMSDNPVATDLLFNYLRDNWQNIFNRFGDTELLIGDVVEYGTSGLSSNLHLTELLAFRNANYKKLTYGRQELKKSVERLEHMVEWKKKYLAIVEEWLRDFNKSTAPLKR